MWLLPPLLLLLIPGSSDLSAVIMGPGEASGPERGSLTVQCRYDPGWEPYLKYWCQGAEFRNCRILVGTTGSEQEVKEDRVSIRDNQTSRMFTVTMENLTREDADTYWCGIERIGADPNVQVKVAVGPGSSGVIMGPEEARGPERGSLTVQCRYDRGWETHVKFWCRGAEFRKCTILVGTTGSEQQVKKDRVSIRDNQKRRTFTVTMEKLRQEDADTYWCGFEKNESNPGVPVRVTVDPATTVLTTIPTTFTVPVTTEVPTSSPTVSSLHPEGRALLSSVHFLLLVFLKLPVFLSMLGAVLWVNRPQGGSEGGGPPRSENQ
ncbi:CMRF35-like molecule 5 isoform X4 [Phyllostomus discolor]|uniref:CMRF35-like molecule 5 isoform X4 n=1 Tax=Phyllostomus discolor TaxID=89673 RepID=A0A7E6EG20_9CHIR|nr:CMRF35-like molecule 5 isoform X4 [Phyllostomus discolor]